MYILSTNRINAMRLVHGLDPISLFQRVSCMSKNYRVNITDVNIKA